MKRQGKGKGKSLLEDLAPHSGTGGGRHKQQAALPAQEEPAFPGAHKTGTMVLALIRGKKDEYHLAKIIQVRPIKDKNEEYNKLEKLLLGN